MAKEGNPTDPYRILFPLGIFSALLGILLWVFFQNRWISFYPRQSHANIMFLACLWSFIIGFLMTALPKMTRTAPAKPIEVGAGVLLIFVQLLLNLRNQTQLAVYVFALQILLLILFAAPRVWSTKIIPFEGFFFLPFSFLQGVLGVSYFSQTGNFSGFYLLSCEALVVNLILGLGSRLIPVISRAPNALLPNVSNSLTNRYSVLTFATVLNATYLLEAFYPSTWALLVRLVIVCIYAVKFFKLFSKPTSFSVTGYGLKLGVVLLIVSIMVKILQPASVAAGHLLYIGFFLLITLMVATRVMLAHGQQNMEYETKSLRMFVVITFLLLAAFARYFANANINSVLMMVSIYSAIFAVLTWGYKFVQILYKPK